MNDYQTILVATDFSPCSATALRQAGRLASGTSATIHVIHVIETDAVEDLAEAGSLDRRDLETQLRREASDRLAEFAEGTLPGVTVEMHVRVGHPLEVTLNAVESLAVDLLVLGVYGIGGQAGGAGTFASKCARRCPTSVLLVHEDQAMPMQTVLACVDFSPASESIARAGARLAALDGATLVLVHVHSNPVDAFGWGASPGASEQYARYVEVRRLKLDGYRDRLATEPDAPEIRCELAFGVDYGRTIVAETKRLDADLVILGVKPRSRFGRALLGSTPEKVLRETSTSVLTVRPTAKPS